MGIRITKKDMLWSYVAYILKVGSNIFILPCMFKYLDKNELGLWYVFAAVGSFILLLDLGFSPTIMRNFSYAWAGAKEVEKTGYNTVDKVEEPNYKLLFTLIKTAQFIYLIISSIALVLMLTIGTIYIRTVSANILSNKIMIAWYVYSLGTFMNLYFSYWNPLLIAIGKVKESQKAVVFSQLSYIIIILIGFKFNLNLIAVSGSYLFMGVILRALSKYYYNKLIGKELHEAFKDIKTKDIMHYTKIMWHNAKRAGIVSIGVYLENNANAIIASSFLGLAQTASYGLTIQIFTAIRAFSSTSMRMYLPLFGDLRVKEENEKVKSVFAKVLVLSWSLFTICTVTIFLIGKPLLGLLGKQSVLPSNFYLIVMSITAFLSFNHGDLFATFITTKNEIPFTKSTVITGVAVVTLSYLLVRLFNMGMWGLLLGSFIAQMCYNNWKWPMFVLKEFKITIFDLISDGVNELRKGFKFSRG